MRHSSLTHILVGVGMRSVQIGLLGLCVVSMLAEHSRSPSPRRE